MMGIQFNKYIYSNRIQRKFSERVQGWCPASSDWHVDLLGPSKEIPLGWRTIVRMLPWVNGYIHALAPSLPCVQ